MFNSTCKCNIRVPSIEHLTVTLKGTSLESESNEFSFELSPQAPVVVDKKVRFNTANMELNKGYPFSYKGKEYFAVRPKEKSIEIYRVKK